MILLDSEQVRGDLSEQVMKGGLQPGDSGMAVVRQATMPAQWLMTWNVGGSLVVKMPMMMLGAT